jgi:hypothetical protein
MVQPKSPPISIRPSEALLAEIDALAERRGMKRHAAILHLLGLGLQWAAPEAPKVKALAEPVTSHPPRPPIKGRVLPVTATGETVVRKALAKGAKR